ncbi:MAG: HNH endonuclease [Fibrella sp.]|nr:HNH endonuclease [Armatimonadota bacterium]
MSQSYIPVALERLVADRARNQCEYCRCLSGFHSDSFATEHITPEVKGGSTESGNLALSCLGCNSFKGAFQTGIDPVTEQEATLFHPREQVWTDHFAWSDDTTHILGLTATGRATVTRLRLNRPGLVNLRAALRHFGVHPPS